MSYQQHCRCLPSMSVAACQLWNRKTDKHESGLTASFSLKGAQRKDKSRNELKEDQDVSASRMDEHVSALPSPGLHRVRYLSST